MRRDGVAWCCLAAMVAGIAASVAGVPAEWTDEQVLGWIVGWTVVAWLEIGGPSWAWASSRVIAGVACCQWARMPWGFWVRWFGLNDFGMRRLAYAVDTLALAMGVLLLLWAAYDVLWRQPAAVAPEPRALPEVAVRSRAMRRPRRPADELVIADGWLRKGGVH